MSDVPTTIPKRIYTIQYKLIKNIEELVRFNLIKRSGDDIVISVIGQMMTSNNKSREVYIRIFRDPQTFTIVVQIDDKPALPYDINLFKNVFITSVSCDFESLQMENRKNVILAYLNYQRKMNIAKSDRKIVSAVQNITRGRLPVEIDEQIMGYHVANLNNALRVSVKSKSKQHGNSI
jgi:hypothetical protein